MKTLFKSNVSHTIEDAVYTKKINIPQYLPNTNSCSIDELCNTLVYGKLMKNINNADVSEEEKQFLRLAASRHIVFNYSKIADYYVNASAEMQQLMEESALIILDVDDAIANGYAKFSSRVSKLLEESGEAVDE